MLKTADEIYFWSGIMKDHADYQASCIPTKEFHFINTASDFRKCFDNLQARAEMLLKESLPLILSQRLISDALTSIEDFIGFKRILIRYLALNPVDGLLTQTFVSHMVNEALEFRRTLLILKENLHLDYAKEVIHLHKIWLPDAWGHAASISSQLDARNKLLKKIAERFRDSFQELYTRIFELGTDIEKLTFDVLSKLNKEIGERINQFIEFLNKISIIKEDYRRSKANIIYIIPEHMISEEKYYLARVDGLSKLGISSHSY